MHEKAVNHDDHSNHDDPDYPDDGSREYVVKKPVNALNLNYKIISMYNVHNY